MMYLLSALAVSQVCQATHKAEQADSSGSLDNAGGRLSFSELQPPSSGPSTPTPVTPSTSEASSKRSSISDLSSVPSIRIPPPPLDIRDLLPNATTEITPDYLEVIKSPGDLEHLGVNGASDGYSKLEIAAATSRVDRICFVDGDNLVELMFPEHRIKYDKGVPVVDDCPKTFFIIMCHGDRETGTLKTFPDFEHKLKTHPRVWACFDLAHVDEMVDYRLWCAGALIKKNRLFDHMKFLVLSGDTFLVVGDKRPPVKKNPGYGYSLVEYMGTPRGIKAPDAHWYERGISLMVGKEKISQKSGGEQKSRIQPMFDLKKQKMKPLNSKADKIKACSANGIRGASKNAKILNRLAKQGLVLGPGPLQPLVSAINNFNCDESFLGSDIWIVNENGSQVKKQIKDLDSGEYPEKYKRPLRQEKLRDIYTKKRRSKYETTEHYEAMIGEVRTTTGCGYTPMFSQLIADKLEALSPRNRNIGDDPKLSEAEQKKKDSLEVRLEGRRNRDFFGGSASSSSD